MSREPDSEWMLDRTELLCRDDTTTGREDHGLPALRDLLEQLGAKVDLQQVEPGRTNVFASWCERPRLLLSTHVDTVPPFLPPQRSGDTLAGRGTCDAKGQAVCQLAAIRTLLGRGLTDLAWLGVVGEETNSIGAARAIAFADRCRDLVAVIDGEPTENLLATGQRGTTHVRIQTHGTPAHSGSPELGASATWPLLDWLQRIRGLELPTDPELGPEIWNLGKLHAGEALNVIPAHARADLFVRALPGSTFADQVRALAPPGGEVEIVGNTPADRFPQLQGFPHAFVPFGSDAPRLRKLAPDGTVALVGPGSIRVAHTADEHITGAELARGHDLLVALAGSLLRR